MANDCRSEHSTRIETKWQSNAVVRVVQFRSESWQHKDRYLYIWLRSRLPVLINFKPSVLLIDDAPRAKTYEILMPERHTRAPLERLVFVALNYIPTAERSSISHLQRSDVEVIKRLPFWCMDWIDDSITLIDNAMEQWKNHYGLCPHYIRFSWFWH